VHPLTRDLLRWYDAHRRHLPWRDEGVSPYRTWVSEVMLQQTRVETVKPYFDRWMERFPDVEALASAPEDEVLSLWSGLGYYSRARNLHRAARVVAAAGAFPTDLAGVRALPGVGEYIAGAIASIALGLDEPAVDGNLERVLSRVHAHPGGRRAVTVLARELLPSGRAGDFNQALMDVGSGICRPRAPRCPDCPLRPHCAGAAAGTPTAFPVRKPKKKAPERGAVGLVFEREGSILLARRPSQGLFGGLYELPGGFVEPGESVRNAALRLARERLETTPASMRPLGSVRHTLTHMRITLHLFRCTGPAPEGAAAFYTDLTWRRADALEGLGTSTLARKGLTLVQKDDLQTRLL